MTRKAILDEFSTDVVPLTATVDAAARIYTFAAVPAFRGTDETTRTRLYIERLLDDSPAALSGHHRLFSHKGLSEEFQQILVFRDATLRRRRDHGVSRSHRHAALQAEAIVVETGCEDRLDRYPAMAGAPRFERHVP